MIEMPDELRDELLRRGFPPEDVDAWHRDDDGHWVIRAKPYTHQVRLTITLLPMS